MMNDENKKNNEQEKFKKEQEKIEKEKKDFEAMIEELQAKLGESSQNVKIIKVEPPTKKDKIVSVFANYLVALITIISLSGYMKWIEYDSFWSVVIFAASTPILEMIIELIIEKYFFKYILYTFGLIIFLVPIISFSVLIFAFPFIKINDYFLAILVIILYMIVKKILVSFIRNLFKGKKQVI